MKRNIFSGINLEWLIKSYNECPDKNSFFNFFDKLAGSDKLRKQIISNMSIEDIKLSWQDDLLEFKKKEKVFNLLIRIYENSCIIIWLWCL